MLTIAKKSEDEMLADLGTELGFPHVRGLAQSRERGRGWMVQAAQRMQEKRTVERTMLVRLKPHDPKKGLVLKQYTYRSIRFQAGRVWYKVNGEIAAYLETVHSLPGDPGTPLAFDVCTPEEARAMDENDRKAARQVLPAEEPLDVSHVRDEYPRANRERSTERNGVPPQQRSPAWPPEDEQFDALDDEVIEDEPPRRRAPRPRHQAVPWPRPRADEFEDYDALKEDDPDAEGAELDGQEAEPPLARRRVEAKATHHRHAYGFDDVPVHRNRQWDEFDEFDAADAAPPSSRRQRSLPDQSREKQTRYPQRYAIEHDELDHGHGQTRHIRGARKAEALNALLNCEARRMRRQHTIENQYKEVPTRCTREGAIERELDDEPIEKLRRSLSQTDQQHALQARHARQMAVTLAGSDALDDAMSHGDAEDSLPIKTTCNRHSSHGDAEDSLPGSTARDRHSSHGDAEDSLPTGSSHMSHGDAEDSLPGSTARDRHSSHGDAEDSLPRPRQSAMHGTYTGHGDAEDSLPRCDRRMQHQDAPSLRHQRGPRAAPDAVDDDFGGRNAEEPSHSDAHGQRAQQPPSSAAHDELDALDDALDDRLQKASEDQRPGSAQPHARGQRAQQPPSSAAHDELDALDDALDDRLTKASEDQRPGSAQPQHGQQRTGSSTQYRPEGAHGAASGADARHEGQPWPDDDPLVNRDTCHQGAASGRELVAAASASARQCRRTDMGMQNSHARDHPDTSGSGHLRSQRPQRSHSPAPERIERLLRAKRCRMRKGADHGGDQQRKTG